MEGVPLVPTHPEVIRLGGGTEQQAWHLRWHCPECCRVHGDVLVSRSVWIFWEKDWFAGQLVEWEPTVSRHRVLFPDGEWLFADLPENFVIYEDEDDGDEDAGGRDTTRGAAGGGEGDVDRGQESGGPLAAFPVVASAIANAVRIVRFRSRRRPAFVPDGFPYTPTADAEFASPTAALAATIANEAAVLERAGVLAVPLLLEEDEEEEASREGRV